MKLANRIINKKGARIKIQPRLNPISYEKPDRIISNGVPIAF